MNAAQVGVARDILRAQLGREPLLRELIERLGGGSRRNVRRYLQRLNAEAPVVPVEQAADQGGECNSPLPPSPPVEVNGLLFGTLVEQVQILCDALEWDLAAVADRLTRQGIPPALGAQTWDKQVVDRCLVHGASHQRALAQEPQRG